MMQSTSAAPVSTKESVQRQLKEQLAQLDAQHEEHLLAMVILQKAQDTATKSQQEDAEEARLQAETYRLVRQSTGHPNYSGAQLYRDR
jgi:hypothetical protein